MPNSKKTNHIQNQNPSFEGKPSPKREDNPWEKIDIGKSTNRSDYNAPKKDGAIKNLKRPIPKGTSKNKPVLFPQTTTLWDFPSQHYGDGHQGNQNYVGVTPSHIIWNTVTRFTKKGDSVLDPFCGSGTTLDVCRDTGRTGIGFDINPTRDGVKKSSATQLPQASSSIQLVFMDPPYSNHINYSDEKECIGKLSAYSEEYFKKMGHAIGEAKRVLVPGGHLAIYVCDFLQKGKEIAPVGFKLFELASQQFSPVDIVACVRRNKDLDDPKFHSDSLKENFFLRGFNYLLIFKNKS